MAQIDQTENSAKIICWGRGDSDFKTFVIKGPTGSALDITGFTFTLTVNTEKNPDPAVPVGTELFSLTGAITDGPNGKVQFAPTSVQTDQVPRMYFYDIQMVDGSSRKTTVIKGVARIVQDITKT